MTAKIDIEVTVKLDYGEVGQTITLTKEDAVALRDALLEAFPINANHWTYQFPHTPNQWTPTYTKPLFGGNLCGGFGGDVTKSGTLYIPDELPNPPFSPQLSNELLDEIMNAMKEPLTDVDVPTHSVRHTYLCKCDGKSVLPGPDGHALSCDGVL